jgi:flavodoxin I
MKNEIVVLFGPEGGNTEKVAHLIAEKIGSEKCTVIPVTQAGINEIKSYNKLIIGGATIGTHNWSHDNTSKDWDKFLPEFRKANFIGKKIALFGLGDQIAYTNHFVDDMRLLYDAVINNGGTVIGQWPTDGYDFNESAAIIDGKFVGLAIDEDHQEDMTNARVEKWVKDILQMF